MMNKGTCEICGGDAGYGNLVCGKCLRTFQFSENKGQVYNATFDPDDGKIRIYSGHVDKPLYAVLTTLGFQRAFKQECFFAVWSPTREDVALALCDEITDEDTSLEDRAEERASRFATYADNAHERAKAADEAAHNLVKNIPLGQPILVGGRNERQHRKTLERAQNLSSQVCKEFDRRDYWKWRAKAVSQNASYKYAERAVVNRIKKLESEIRKTKKTLSEAALKNKLWNAPGLTFEDALGIANFDWVSAEFHLDKYPRDHHTYEGSKSIYSALEDGIIDENEAREICVGVHERTIKASTRWLEYYEGQLIYWKSFMVENHGKSIDDQHEIKKGQWVMIHRWHNPSWAQVTRINRGSEKRITTVTINPATQKGYRHYTDKWGYQDIKAIYDTEPTLEEIMAAIEPQPEVKREEPDPEIVAAKEALFSLNNVKVVVNTNPDFFPTPMPLVERMIEEARITPGDLCLEPSAGDGRIARAMKDAGGVVEVAELDEVATEVLCKEFYPVYVGDFLKMEHGPYDVVVMNPPFSNEQDILHVVHAYNMLRPGGRLVAIMSEHGFFASNKRCVEFREWLSKYGWSEQLPEDAFVESGTHVRTRLVVIDKPAK